MATLAATKICLLWYRIVQQGGSLEGTPWNMAAGANPDTLEGGIPFNVGACITEPLFLTGCGTGDAGIDMAFGPPFNPFAEIPETYTPGWFNDAGGIDIWDIASTQGGCTVSGGQLFNGAGAGAARSRTSKTQGRYYVEYTVRYDIFSNQTGVGIMRKGAQLGPMIAGELTSGDPIGGAMIQGGQLGSYVTNVNVFGNSFAPNNFVEGVTDTVMGMAIALIPQAVFVPQLFSAVPLPRLTCCPATQQLRLRQQLDALKKSQALDITETLPITYVTPGL